MNRWRRADARRSGITLIELLVVLGVLAIVFSLAAILGRGIAQRASERSAVNSVQQAVWQGATLAAARGFRTELVRVVPASGPELQIRRLSDGSVLRRFELDPNVNVNFDGQVLVFTPPGTIAPESLIALASLPGGGLRVTAAGATYALQVSLIGEVRVQ